MPRIPARRASVDGPATAIARATAPTEPELITGAEREFLMPIVRYLRVLLEWSREREAAATMPTVQPVSGGQPEDSQPYGNPRRKKRSRRP